MTSAYEELVKRCADELSQDRADETARAILAEVLRTLETVTPEMDAAGHDTGRTDFDDDVSVIYLAALHASPIAPTGKSDE